MKNKIFLCALALVSVSAQGHRIALHNKTSYFLKVNIGAQARPGSYHVIVSPGKSRVLETVGYIPSWLSAYAYPSDTFSKRNEIIIVENLGLPNAFLAEAYKLSCCIYNDRVEINCGSLYYDDSNLPLARSDGNDF